MNSKQNPAPVLTRLVKTDRIDAADLEILFEADPAEKQTIASFLGLVALDALTWTARLRRLPNGKTVALRVNLTADVIQPCVITLEPVHSRIEHSFSRLLAPADVIGSSALGESGELEVEVEGEDPPDELTDDYVDIGAAITEELALTLNPYPRKQGTVFETEVDQGGGFEKSDRIKPFSNLKDLTTRAWEMLPAAGG